MLLKQKGIDINTYGVCLFFIMLTSNNWCFKIMFGIFSNRMDTAFMCACFNGHLDVAKLLLEHKDIDINAENVYSPIMFLILFY